MHSWLLHLSVPINKGNDTETVNVKLAGLTLTISVNSEFSEQGVIAFFVRLQRIEH